MFTVVLLGVAATLSAHNQNARIAELERRVARLEKASSFKQGNVTSTSKADDKANVTQQRVKARKRMMEDYRRYSKKQRREIESLYKSRGYKYGSPEKTKNLKLVTSKYSRSNRAGCAMLYLGQFSGEDDKQEYYLKKAINNYSDCFYGNGVQVGAYARFWLANIYKKTGRQDKAHELYKEIKAKYPNAIDHKGKRLAPQIDAIIN